MKAVFIREFGGIENLEIREVEEPVHPKGKEIIVRVRACGVNRADILQRRGLYPAPKDAPQRIPGLEFAGEIIKIGEKVKKFRLGERVFGITSGGAQAELIKTHESILMKIPNGLNYTKAAAIAEAFITAHDALFTLSKLKRNETVLIHSAGSGVGIAAVQLAKLIGAKVIGTSRTAEKLEKCAKFGLDVPILIKSDADFADILRKLGGVDVILDLVGAAYFRQNLESLKKKGRIVLVGLVGGAKTEFNLGIALSKRLTIIGTVLRSRSLKEKAQAIRKFERMLPFFEDQTLKPVVDKVFKVSDVRLAHEYIESNKNFGKVILEF